MTHLDWDQLRQTSLNPGGFGKERMTIWYACLARNACVVRVAESSRPQVLNASTSSPTSSEPPPNGNLVLHEEGGETVAPLSHPDERQIMLDTDRSFVHYPTGEALFFIPTMIQ